ncbi:MAG: pilus assembly protein [Gammaproteobacteria bacterium]|nr:pilus assembly protein [Gammaproteobacteria bacterium]
MRGGIIKGAPAHQRGAAAIEFALIFIPMFALFYALVSYGLIMALLQGMTLAAEEGARVAVAVDRSAYADTPAGTDEYMNVVTPRVRNQVGLSLAWLPDTLKARVLGDGNVQVGVVLNGAVLEVTVRYPNYADTPLIPTLVLPGIGPVPRVGNELRAQANIRL